ncbi:MAG TPA: DUF4342 domain-containing protein [Clostridiales bacterium]|nr:DUF4342 domain-containing protein [Clostridiales bacterium]
MEITLEKIELVKDRTGVSYKEAKEALEAANGSVVDAIVAIEEMIDHKSGSKVSEHGAQLMDKIKTAIKKGNVSKIIVKKDDDVLLNLPVNIGIIGTVLAPWAAVAGVIAVFGTKCTVELVKDSGEIVELSEIASDTFNDVVYKGSVLADEVKTRGSDVLDNVKTKASEVMSKVKKEDEESEDYDENEEDEESEDYDCACGSDEECDADCYCGCTEDNSQKPIE